MKTKTKKQKKKKKLWKDVDLKRAIQDWNMNYVDIARSPGSAIRVFTSSERLANQLKINEIGEVGKLVRNIEMGDPKKLGTLEKLEDW